MSIADNELGEQKTVADYSLSTRQIQINYKKVISRDKNEAVEAYL